MPSPPDRLSPRALLLVPLLAVTATIGCASKSPEQPATERVSPSSTTVSQPAQVAAPDAAPSPNGVSGATIQAGGPSMDPSGELDAAAYLAAQRRTIEAQRSRPVFVVASTDPTRAAMALMDRLSPSVEPDTPVLIKPNLGGFTWFRNGPDNGLIGRTTDPGFVEGMILWLTDRGVKKVTIAESWGVDDPAQVRRLFKVSGYDRIAARHPQVRLVDMNHYGGAGPDDDLTHPVAVPMPEAVSLREGLVLPSIYVEHITRGLVIDVPKLKTHQLATVTCGVKNLMGVIGLRGTGFAHRNKWRMHAEVKPYLESKNKNFDEDARTDLTGIVQKFTDRLLDAFVAAHPHLTLVDGVLAADGDGFDRTSSVPLGAAIGSYNTVYADITAAKAAGIWNNGDLEAGWLGSRGPHHLEKAMERFYPGVSADTIVVEGDRSIASRGGRFDLDAIGPWRMEGNAAKFFSGTGDIVARYLGKEADPSEDLMALEPARGSIWLMGDWKGDRLPVGVATRIWSGYSDEEVVFVFRSRYRTLAETGPAQDRGDVKDLFKGDVVEVFVDPDPSTPMTYYEMELAPGGGRLDLSVDLEARSFVDTWESGMTGASMRHESWSGWDAVIRVPFGEIPRPEEGDRWKVNFFRTEGRGKQRLYMAWRPTGTPSPRFHVPDRFGSMVFGPVEAR